VPFILSNNLQLTQILFNSQVNYGLAALKINSEIVGTQRDIAIQEVRYQVSNTLSGLAAGNYRAYVQDSLGCIDSISFTITQPAAIAIDVVLTQNKCHNDATGAIALSPRGGTAPYQYSIDGGASFNFTNTFTGLTAGTFVVVVKDRNNCSSTINITLNNPSLFVIDATGIDVQCWDSENGSISVASSGGTTPYSLFEYSQNGLVYNNSPFAIFENLTSGFYYLFMTFISSFLI
jgi:hypothetical protein